MNVYISKVENSHKFVISKTEHGFQVIKPSGEVYQYLDDDNDGGFGMDQFVTNDEANDSLTQEEKNEKDNDYITSDLNSSILNGSGYGIFGTMLDNISKLADARYLFYFTIPKDEEGNDTENSEDYILMIKDVDTEKEIDALDGQDMEQDELSKFFGVNISKE